MIIKFFSFLFLFISLSSFSQSEKTAGYLSREDNETWLANFEKLASKDLKLEAIKQKTLSDSEYVEPRPGMCLTGLNNRQRAALRKSNNTKPKPTAACKILFVLHTENTYPIDLQKSPQYLPLVKMLKAENITSVQVLKGISASALYGSRASCGLVIMTSEGDRITEALQKLNNQKTIKS